MIVVSDTSPILNLAAVDKLHLLRDLYAEIVVPPSVQRELFRNGIQLDPSWTRVVAAQDQNDVAALREQLDPGEAEAIVVAAELPNWRPSFSWSMKSVAAASRSTVVWK